MVSQAAFHARTLPIKLAGLTDREACQDVLIRLLQGIDDNSEEFLMSVFDPSIVYDLSHMSVIGASFGRYSGRDEVVAYIRNSVGVMDTLHQATNIRVDIQGDDATLTAFALEQHFQEGEGHAGDKKSYLMGNRWWAALIREEEGLWRMKHVELYNMWTQGDMLDAFSRFAL